MIASRPTSSRRSIPAIKGRFVRFDAAERPAAETSESVYLSSWLARQAGLYNNLLATIAHVPSADRHQRLS